MTRAALLKLAAATLVGVVSAGLLILSMGRASPSATIAGTVSGVVEGRSVVVLASRNACAQTGRRPLALAWTEVQSAGEFTLSIPHVGPGAAYVCAYERGADTHIQGPYSRWDQVRLPVRGADGFSHRNVSLSVAPGLPVFTDGRGRR